MEITLKVKYEIGDTESEIDYVTNSFEAAEDWLDMAKGLTGNAPRKLEVKVEDEDSDRTARDYE